jgi:hypothetical protein
MKAILSASFLALGLTAIGCGIFASVDRGLIPGQGGAGGTGGAGGADCTAPEDCPGIDDACKARRCAAGECGTDFAAAGAPCPEGVCDGSGECVECVSEDQCAEGEACVDDGCISILCTNGQVDPGESDVDCGGPSCPGCANGQTCDTYTDCASRFCDAGTCAPCVGDGDCVLTDWCDEAAGVCILKTNVGGSCDEPGQCTSGYCVDAICCENLCTDACESCDSPGNEGACIPYAAGTDPENECGGAGCSGADNCMGATCGDGIEGPEEGCDDGNSDSYDGCSALCQLPAAHLLISEIVTAPAGAAFVEIYNPLNVAVALDDVYLADFASYHLVTTSSASPSNTDFLIRFPLGATVGPGGFMVVSLDSASNFTSAYGLAPDFDLRANDAGAPVMVGSFGPNAALATAGEPLILFSWDGSADLVTDLDYLSYGSPPEIVNKTGVTVGASSYLPDTANQIAAPAPPSGQSIHRCDTSETTEVETGGNGATGHDETSEAGTPSFKLLTAPTPGGAPPAGFCP